MRKWRHKSTLGVQGSWLLEVGESLAGPVASLESDMIKENSSNVGVFPPLNILIRSLHLIYICEVHLHFVSSARVHA